MDGAWEAIYPCETDSSSYGDPNEKKCEAGVRDYFDLQLWSEGGLICGTHAATAHLGNRVDEDEDWGPSIAGLLKGNSASVRFRSSWGGTGHASIRLEAGALYWDVLDHDAGTSWIPDHAVLSRKANDHPQKPPVCLGKLAN